MTEAQEERTDSQARQDALTKSYTMALATLREQHLDEFNALRVTAAKQLGYDWSPKPTPEQIAQAEIESYLDQYPRLRELFAQTGAEPQPEASEGG